MSKTYCIFAAQYLPHLGGVERYTYNLSKKLIEKGNKVVVVTSNVQGLVAYEKIEGVEIYRMPCINLLDGRYPVLKFNREFRKIHRILRQKKFDMVVVNTRFYIHSVYGQWFAKNKGVRCITIDHGTSHLSVHNKFLDVVGDVYEHIITKVGQIFCKDYYGVSNACNEWLKHFHITAKGTLYNAVDLEQIETLKRNIAPKYREQHGIREQDIVITFVGRLLEEKGIPSLIKAVKKIHKKNRQVYLFIAGDGDLERYVEREATANIIPLGRLAFEDVIGLLNESDIFCLPSFSEGFSTSLLEAAACGCYIVTTKRGGAKELLINDEYGSVIEDNAADKVYHALVQAIKSDEKRSKAVRLTYDYLARNFTWENTSERLRRL